MDHTFVDAFITRGRAFLCTDQSDKTIADCTDAIRLNPQSAEAYVVRGTAWFVKQQYEKAVTDSTAAIRLDPKGCESAYEVRAAAQLVKGKYGEAIADWTAESQLNPTSARVRDNLTKIQEFMGDIKKTEARNSETAARSKSGTNRELKRSAPAP